jgi:hypothetical protein
MWDGMSGPLPYVPARGPADLDARIVEQPPGPPPWSPRLRLSTIGFGLLLAVGAAGAVASLGLAAWRLIDQASDLR